MAMAANVAAEDGGRQPDQNELRIKLAAMQKVGWLTGFAAAGRKTFLLRERAYLY